jgi:hypothetical protein
MWSSVVLLKCDVVDLSLDERNDIRLNNFIPIAYTGQISGDNNQNVYQMNSSDVKCYWSDGLVKNALFDNILYTINKFNFDIDL